MKRKKRSLTIALFRITGGFIIIAIVVYFATSYFTRPPHIRYTAFGIDIPQNYLLHGIDVSRYQQVINWSDVKEMEIENIRIGFAFIKATEGLNKVDAQFRRNWLQAEKEDITLSLIHI